MDPSLYTNKQQKLKEQQAESKRLRDERKGLYKLVNKQHPAFMKDLLAFLEANYSAYQNSAQKASGIINNEPTSLTMEQRTSLLDKADGISIIRAYIENNLA